MAASDRQRSCTAVFFRPRFAWTAAQPGVTHVLVGGRTLAQATENAKAGELQMEVADLGRIRKAVIALGKPAEA